MNTQPNPLTALMLISLLSVQVSVSIGQDSSAEKDVSSLDNIVNALYASISGEKGEPRDWDKFRKLFVEEARLIPTGIDSSGNIRLGTWTPEQYVQNANDWLVQNGFHENEIHRVTETFGNLTHIFSTYESRHSRHDEKPFSRGINSIQLLNDGKRWWVVNIYWLSENEKNPIPDKYLPN
ncbi:MAG: hypothetical protein MI921_25245 [Cytophagales bacterium]|nr:hypothetical protein [Cytophagales bacterium]